MSRKTKKPATYLTLKTSLPAIHAVPDHTKENKPLLADRNSLTLPAGSSPSVPTKATLTRPSATPVSQRVGNRRYRLLFRLPQDDSAAPFRKATASVRDVAVAVVLLRERYPDADIITAYLLSPLTQ